MSPGAATAGLGAAAAARAHLMVGEDERRARLAWTLVAEIGSERPGDDRSSVQLRIVEVGPLAAWHELVDGVIGRRGAVRARVAEIDIDAELARLARVGARTVVPGDDDWPDRLDGPDAPVLLHVRGEGSLAGLVDRSVAIVGSRASTGYGEHMARELGAGAATRGWTVVSGAAYGIDASAHLGALAADGPCVAVLPCGPDRVYPVGSQGLVGQVARTGLVVTEHPVGAVARRHRFLSRNRIIAALSRATCVVEAGLRSGSLNTASWAEHHHRPVGAVPGPVTSMSSAGCHEWIRSGQASLVTDAAELLALAAPIGEELDGVDGPRVVPHGADLLGSVQRRIHDALQVRRPRSVEEIAREALLSPAEVLDHLALLELEGWASRGDAGWRRGSGPT